MLIGKREYKVSDIVRLTFDLHLFRMCYLVLKTITKTVVPNVTLMWIIYNKLVTRITKQTVLHGFNVSRTTQSTSKENTIPSKCS